MTIRLALLGCGSHCHNQHLPALRRLRDDMPDRAKRLRSATAILIWLAALLMSSLLQWSLRILRRC